MSETKPKERERGEKAGEKEKRKRVVEEKNGREEKGEIEREKESLPHTFPYTECGYSHETQNARWSAPFPQRGSRP